MAIGAKLRYQVLRRDNYTCRFCGSSAPDVLLEIDHVKPRAEGGRDIAENLQVLCEECNAGKSMTMPEKWLVKEVKAKQRLWERGKDPVPPGEDDFAEMYAFLDADEFLSSRTSKEVLEALMRVCADVFPYRPDHSELFIAAAKVIREAPAPTGVPF